MTRNQIIYAIHEMISGFRVAIGETAYAPLNPLGSDYYDLLDGAITLVQNNPEITAKDIHDYWLDWAVVHRPEHESIIPFERLSATEKMKDEFVISIIRGIVKYL